MAGWAEPGDRNHLIMPSWRSLETLVMQTISQDRIIKYEAISGNSPSVGNEWKIFILLTLQSIGMSHKL